MRKSKYLGMKSGEWACTYFSVSRVQPKFKQGTKVYSKRPGHQTYYYIFERLTSDKKAMKMIRLNAAQASMVWKGLKTVEYFSELKEAKRSQDFTRKVSYSFCD